jgi:hypothetical protein
MPNENIYIRDTLPRAACGSRPTSWSSLTKSVAQEPEDSSPHSQQPATGPCPEPVESNPHPPKPISLRSILTPSSHLCLGFPSGLFPSGFPTKTLYTFLSSPMRVTCPVHLIRLDLTCLMISPFPRHLIPLRSKYSSQNPVLKHPQSMLFP